MSPASTWPWQRLNEGNATSHRLLATLLEPKPGERWLDVGTGGGGLALELARSGASVVGVDVAADGLEHARAAAADAGLEVVFEVADAQELPYPDGAFDGVASAFGVIFAAEPGQAAGELARVCKRGGRLGLTLMPRASRAAALWSALLRHGHPGPHPAAWEQELERLLGEAFQLETRLQESPGGRRQSTSWAEQVQQFAPLRKLVEGLDEEGAAALRAEFEEIDASFAQTPPSAVVVLGERR